MGTRLFWKSESDKDQPRSYIFLLGIENQRSRSSRQLFKKKVCLFVFLFLIFLLYFFGFYVFYIFLSKKVLSKGIQYSNNYCRNSNFKIFIIIIALFYFF